MVPLSSSGDITTVSDGFDGDKNLKFLQCLQNAKF